MTETDPKERMIALLLTTPGISTARVARELELDPSTVDHHLRRMRRVGRVSSMTVGRENCWFATRSGFCPVLQRAIPAMRRAEVAAVARVLEDFAQTSPTLATRSGVDVGQARWAANMLVGYGIATRTNGRLLLLAPGAGTCVRKALAGERCGEWGRCAPSQRWERENAISVAPSGSRGSADRSSGPPRAPSSE